MSYWTCWPANWSSAEGEECQPASRRADRLARGRARRAKLRGQLSSAEASKRGPQPSSGRGLTMGVVLPRSRRRCRVRAYCQVGSRFAANAAIARQSSVVRATSLFYGSGVTTGKVTSASYPLNFPAEVDATACTSERRQVAAGIATYARSSGGNARILEIVRWWHGVPDASATAGAIGSDHIPLSSAMARCYPLGRAESESACRGFEYSLRCCSTAALCNPHKS